VFNYVARKMGYQEHEAYLLQADYMKLRGVESWPKHYTGAQWHVTPGEIIANDFRILFTKQEMEFWPHEVPLPAWSGAEGKWWKHAAEISK
jgi:hypothetical protein